ncbi:MAG: AAA family ATPase [Thermaerobacter sp.]|nr:AAA family ATPase [Thermaerobacter sp.]
MNHAWLLIGPPGPQRREAARRKAAALIGATDERLQMVLLGRHADVAEYLQPLRIDDVRQVTAGLARAPLLGESRAVLFGEMSGTTREAQNALLRVVEEPPVDLVFVGEVARTTDLLATLQSRFVALRLPRLPAGEVEDLLRAEAPQAKEQLVHAAARFARGYLDPARETLAALSEVAEKLPADDGTPDWFVRAAEAVESAGETWLNGLAGAFSAYFESTAEIRYLYAWEKVEQARSALLRNANARLAAEALFSELSELGVLRHGASGWDPVP